MIWYRHWLELRAAALALVGTAIIGSLFHVRDFVAGAGDSLATRVDRRLFAPLMSLTDSLSPAQLNLIVFHQEFTWYAILLLSFALAGDGLRVFARWTNTPLPGAAQFTLSLPVSRRRVVVTRILSSYAIGAIALLAITGTHAVAFSFTAHAVPLEQLLLASGFASLLVLFWSSMFVLLHVIVGPAWGTAVAAIAMLFSTLAGMHGMSASAALTLHPGLIVLFAVTLGVVLAGAVVATTSEEV